MFKLGLFKGKNAFSPPPAKPAEPPPLRLLSSLCLVLLFALHACGIKTPVSLPLEEDDQKQSEKQK